MIMGKFKIGDKAIGKGITIDSDVVYAEYEGKQVTFDIVEKNGNELTLISRDILCFEPFDIKSSNDYSKSSIKCFLNDEFKRRFNKEFIDKLQGEFFLPSEDEIKKWYPKPEDRIKRYKNELYWYWLRTPTASYSHSVRGVNTDGSLNSYVADGARGLAAACKIILNQ